MVLPDSRRVPRAPRYSGTVPGRRLHFGYRAVTCYGCPFQNILLYRHFVTPRKLRRTLRTEPTTPTAQRLRAYTQLVWALPISLATTLGISLDFSSCRYLDVSIPCVRLHTLCIQAWIPEHDLRWVSPFGNPRIKACLAAPRGLSQPATSFIASQYQGIHHTPLVA